MPQTDFEVISSIIKNRRSIAPEQMNGKIISDEVVYELLELARWAPTHGMTEPLRFTVFSGNGKITFSFDHAEMYKTTTAVQDFVQNKYDKILHRSDNASHVIAIGVKCGTKSNIPDIEEIASVSCSVMNIWLAASAKGIACYWGSGGMAYHSLMKNYLGLEEGDKVLGFLFLGYSNFKPAISKRSPVEDKVKFVTA